MALHGQVHEMDKYRFATLPDVLSINLDTGMPTARRYLPELVSAEKLRYNARFDDPNLPFRRDAHHHHPAAGVLRHRDARGAVRAS